MCHEFLPPWASAMELGMELVFLSSNFFLSHQDIFCSKLMTVIFLTGEKLQKFHSDISGILCFNLQTLKLQWNENWHKTKLTKMSKCNLWSSALFYLFSPGKTCQIHLPHKYSCFWKTFLLQKYISCTNSTQLYLSLKSGIESTAWKLIQVRTNQLQC